MEIFLSALNRISSTSKECYWLNMLLHPLEQHLPEFVNMLSACNSVCSLLQALYCRVKPFFVLAPAMFDWLYYTQLSVNFDGLFI